VRRHTAKSLVVSIAVALIFVVSAQAAAAAEFEIIPGPLGKKGLKNKALNVQVFTFAAGAVECTREASEGVAPGLKFETFKEKVTFTGCTAFGFVEVKATPTELEFADAKGWVSFLKPLTFEIPLAGCSVTITNPLNNERKAVTYANAAKKVQIKVAANNIRYETTGGICGAGGIAASYTGNAELELEEGEIKA
jgi:hypothetical protein